MKTFKYYLAAFAIALCAGFTSCSDEYDDSEIWDKVNELLSRVQKLEASIEKQNANISAFQTMLDAIKDNVYVTSVEELADGKGYSLKFSNGKEVSIYHGENGKSPKITIIKEGDNYYWSVDNEVLKDNEGNNIPADGGAADVLPLLKTGSQLEADGVAGTWEKDAVYLSTDKVTWKKLNLGSGNADSSIFTSVETSEDGLTVIITLSDGSTITMPKYNKMQEMLYGIWTKEEHWDLDGKITITFGSNNSFTYNYSSSIDGDETWTGIYRFIPERYIHCTGETDHGEGFDFVFTVVEVTENKLIINGSDICEGAFTR